MHVTLSIEIKKKEFANFLHRKFINVAISLIVKLPQYITKERAVIQLTVQSHSTQYIIPSLDDSFIRNKYRNRDHRATVRFCVVQSRRDSISIGRWLVYRLQLLNHRGSISPAVAATGGCRVIYFASFASRAAYPYFYLVSHRSARVTREIYDVVDPTDRLEIPLDIGPRRGPAPFFFHQNRFEPFFCSVDRGASNSLH